MSNTRSQRMATEAHQVVDKRRDLNGENAGYTNKEYKSVARGYPSFLHTCGLVQALTFSKSKQKPEHTHIIEDLQNVLRKAGALSQNDDLLVRATSADTSAYILLHAQAIEAAVWIKRYAEAFAKPKDSDAPAN